MVKKANNLIPAIACPDNLRLAFWKARKGKSWASQVCVYREQLDQNLSELREQILSGAVSVGSYRYFKVYDPKERQICASAFREQVLHHALMNVCHEYFEKVQIYDSYASRPGKGVHAALKRAKGWHRPGSWFLQLDIKQFFATVQHDHLKNQLARMFKEKRLLQILGQIIDSYETEPGRGLPIGNLTSQYFANHYLAGLDHYIKERLICKNYVRYMDDLVLWHRDRDWLRECYREIGEFVESRLGQELKQHRLNRTERGLPFCGYVLFPYFSRLSQRSKRRFIKKLSEIENKLRNGVWTEKTCQRHTLPLVAFTRHADTVRFRRNVVQRIESR